jgi:hypothetical protein
MLMCFTVEVLTLNPLFHCFDSIVVMVSVFNDNIFCALYHHTLLATMVQYFNTMPHDDIGFSL